MSALPAIPLAARAVLFDLGGTLDGDGAHWLDRFYRIYEKAGAAFPRAHIREAFDYAERKASQDAAMMQAHFDGMVALHVRWQFENLASDDRQLETEVHQAFVAETGAVTSRSAALLAELRGRGFVLGVLSNGCGNTEVLCRDFGFSPYLEVVLDSRSVGLSKPDPHFFLHAAGQLGIAPADILMVGDSFARDIAPAKEIGMRTAWLTNDEANPKADLQIESLDRLTARISLRR